VWGFWVHFPLELLNFFLATISGTLLIQGSAGVKLTTFAADMLPLFRDDIENEHYFIFVLVLHLYGVLIYYEEIFTFLLYLVESHPYT
jgi:hypothetical protein